MLASASASQSRTPDCLTRIETLLRLVPAFEALPHPVLQRLGAMCSLIEVDEAQPVCREGEPADALMILLQGTIALFGAAANGNRAVVELIDTRAPILLATVLAGLPYPMSAEAVSPCQLLQMNADGLHDLMATSTQLTTCLVRAQAQDFGAMVRQVCDLKLRTASERLASFLLSLSRDQHTTTAQLRLPVRKHCWPHSLAVDRRICRALSLPCAASESKLTACGLYCMIFRVCVPSLLREYNVERRNPEA